MSQNLLSAAVMIKIVFFYISTKTYVVGTQKNPCFIEFGEFSGRVVEVPGRHYVVSLSKTLYLQCLVNSTCSKHPDVTKKLLAGT